MHDVLTGLAVIVALSTPCAASDATPSTRTTPTCRLSDSRVESLIASVAARVRGEESCSSRRYDGDDDLDGDGQDDFLVLFRIEHGNLADHYAAVFLSSRPREPLTVLLASGDAFIPDDISVQDGTLVIDTLEYVKGDPHCCPSGSGQLTFSLTRKGLVLLSHTKSDA